eukprot:TRINITY_DN837_c0_g1_i3.p1 TRINITY_DN837_c0_g1~~TRINITY_DN837_c0_g1_i3.p1  ORF type:complete len:329 (+),score=65.61 TRINITY_DN837_c0_g1_i3:43-1029(+)
MSSTIPARIAFTEFLLSECVIVANRTALRLVELEIYHYNNADHSDPFAHCDELQSRWGRFYFHKMGGAYKGGTYKGLDITFGGLDRHREGSDTSDGGLVEYGGILVRAIQVASSGEVVEGPSLTVDKILSLTKKTAVKDLAEVLGGDEAPAWYPQNVWDGVAERFKMRAPQPIPYHACPPLLYLTTVEEAKKIGVLKDERWSVDIVRGPRVGLNLPAMSRIVGDPEAGGKKRKTIADSHEKNATPDDYCSYIGRPYRLISQAAKIKKGRQLIAVGMHIFHDAKPFQIEQEGTGLPVFVCDIHLHKPVLLAIENWDEECDNNRLSGFIC